MPVDMMRQNGSTRWRVRTRRWPGFVGSWRRKEEAACWLISDRRGLVRSRKISLSVQVFLRDRGVWVDVQDIWKGKHAALGGLDVAVGLDRAGVH